MLACRENDNKKSGNEIKRMHLHQLLGMQPAAQTVTHVSFQDDARPNDTIKQCSAATLYSELVGGPVGSFSQIQMILLTQTFYVVIVLGDKMKPQLVSRDVKDSQSNPVSTHVARMRQSISTQLAAERQSHAVQTRPVKDRGHDMTAALVLT